MTLALVTVSLTLTFASSALASKQVVDFFGGTGTLGGQFTESTGGVAINETGAGGVPVGTVYVSDGGTSSDPSFNANRIERFERDNNGTPADPSDDTYPFISAWGAGVISGGTSFEVCTSALACLRGTSSGGNGSMAGNGGLKGPAGIAVDQDTGEVYVVDGGPKVEAPLSANNFRISVYSATGSFLRSFGWDVVQSGPDDNGTGYEICKAQSDVCQSGVPGSGVGQLGVAIGGQSAPRGIAVSQPDGNPDSGTVFAGDMANHRINTYNLDGSSPGSIGSSATFNGEQPYALAVDSRGIVYASNSKNNGQLERYDSQNANGNGVGFLSPIAASVSETQKLTVKATAGQFRLSYDGEATTDITIKAFMAASIQAALRALPSVGNNVSVFGEGPYSVQFQSELGERDVEQLSVSNGTTPLSGGPVEIETAIQGQTEALPTSRGSEGLAVAGDNDGPGPDSDTLYVLYGNVKGILQFGPNNPPGATVPPATFDDAHGTVYPYIFPRALAVEQETGRIYVASRSSESDATAQEVGVFVLDTTGPPQVATLDSLSDISARSAVAHATIDPNGPPNTSYHFEYSTDQANWTSGPTVLLGHQEDPQSVEGIIGPGSGLHPKTHYYVRLSTERRFAAPVVTSSLDFTTGSAPPLAETVGSPLRTTTTAQLNGRVVPSNTATEYHFEYGDQGSCVTNPCTSTALKAAGSDDESVFVAEQLEGLAPETTYHYRVIADNGSSAGPAIGEDMTVTTRASDAPLAHGRFPGPPGSDRAYEQVSLPDAGGNPVASTFAASDAGDRAFYQVSGGTPSSVSGSAFTPLYAARFQTAPHQGGWRSENIFPLRDELIGSGWHEPAGRLDLSDQVMQNFNTSSARTAIWRIRPGQPAAKILEPELANFRGPVVVSEDASRVLTNLKGALDPAHTPPNNAANVYDVTSGIPRLIGLLPNGSVSSCGSTTGGGEGDGAAANVPRAPHWASADGSLAFFNVCADLYLRDFDTEESELIALNSDLVKSVPGGVFVVSRRSLVPEDVGGDDLYRYDLSDETLECITCVVAGLPANVLSAVVADDGSRAYFTSPTALVPGAATPSIYRVSVASGDLAYVAPAALVNNVGEALQAGNAISPDGSTYVFASKNTNLNPLGGHQNGGTLQFYRYEDDDRSLTCFSCPQDASAPGAAVSAALLGNGGKGTGANRTALSADGRTLAFASPNALLPADQNTARPGQIPSVGADIYEWRDGRLLMVTDGLTEWAGVGPTLGAVTPSGNDIFFIAATQYTQDALDGYSRLYDARIGGGFEFPPPPKPCPLEVCQGTPKGAPEEQEPGSGNFVGPGNKTSTPSRRSCLKGRHKARKSSKASCVKSKGKKQQKRQRAKHDRRTAR